MCSDTHTIINVATHRLRKNPIKHAAVKSVIGGDPAKRVHESMQRKPLRHLLWFQNINATTHATNNAMETTSNTDNNKQHNGNNDIEASPEMTPQ